jgi:hypothetical protein
VEQDALEIFSIISECIKVGIEKFTALGHNVSEIKGLRMWFEKEENVIVIKSCGHS